MHTAGRPRLSGILASVDPLLRFGWTPIASMLFFARDVMKLELGDLSHAVRAKRGPRLPVVMSGSEV